MLETKFFISLREKLKPNDMKTRILLLVFALAATTLHAQREDDYLLWNSRVGDYGEDGVYCIAPVNKIMQQRDGNIIIPASFAIAYHDGHLLPTYVGDVFYKLSPSPLTMVDSMFVAVTDTVWPPYFLFDRDPQGEGNIRATIKYDEEKDSTFLVISRFSDDSFYINHDEDILSPLGRGRLYDRESGYMIDCRGDLIMKYWSSGYDSVYMARFGLDGTLKHKAPLPSILNDAYNMEVLDESPLQYWQRSGYFSANDSLGLDSIFHLNASLGFFVMDSAFQLNGTTIIHSLLHGEMWLDTLGHPFFIREYLEFNSDTRVIPVDGDDLLVATQYTHDTMPCPNPEKGVAIAKYDRHTAERKALIVFNDYPGWNRDARAMGLKQMSDGTVYFLYRERGYPAEGFVVVKMDTDLNIEWKRWYKTNPLAVGPLHNPILYEDENGEEKGIAWVGTGTREGEEPGPGQVGKMDLVLLLLNHDGPVGVNEGNAGVEMRPYSIYPNPAKSQLNMRFSPDVQPAQVELYDLQGRLMRHQRNDFEHIDMSSLPAGTYLIRVTLKDGQVFSDKVVKE